MTVNLAWRDAMAEVGVAFNKACQSAGWADTFTPWQIAVLQRPNKKGDREGKLACDALFRTLDHDCKSGALAHSTLTVKAPPRQPLTPQAIGHRSWATSWEGGESEGQRRDRLWLEGNPPQTTKTEQQTHITAADFAAWLSTNQIDPSRHIAAWFVAAGVSTVREQPQDAAPVVPDSASHAPEMSPPPVATRRIAVAFAGLRGWDEKAWKDNLGSPPKWLEACIALRGQRGIREHHWNPVLIGAALVRDGHAKPNNIRARFQTKRQLEDWKEAWKTYEADNFDTQ